MLVGIIRQKQPSEKFPVSIDYTANLFGGTVISAVVTAARQSDDTDLSASVLDGAAVISSPFVTQGIKGGTIGDTIILEFAATMSGGQVIEDEVLVVVLDVG